MNKKIKLDQLKIKSFILSDKLDYIKGGDDVIFSFVEGPCYNHKASASGCIQCSSVGNDC